jgi:hypothetical protein
MTSDLATPHVPNLPAARLALLRSVLIDALPPTPSSRSSALWSSHRRLVVVAAALLSIAVIGTAVAAWNVTDFMGEQARVDQAYWTPPPLERVGRRVELSRGSDWSFMAWKSKTGVCVAYAAGQTDYWVRACGRRPGTSVEGAHTSKYLLVFGMTPGSARGSSDGRGAIFGAVEPAVARVSIELPGGRVASAETMNGDSLRTPARFFIIRASSLTRATHTRAPISAITSYSRSGAELERFPAGPS